MYKEKTLGCAWRGVLAVLCSVTRSDIVRIAVRQPTSPNIRVQSPAREVRREVEIRHHSSLKMKSWR
jgi:hypothetical protein